MSIDVDGLEVDIVKLRKWWCWHVPWMAPVTGFKTPLAALKSFVRAYEAGRVAPRPRQLGPQI